MGYARKSRPRRELVQWAWGHAAGSIGDPALWFTDKEWAWIRAEPGLVEHLEDVMRERESDARRARLYIHGLSTCDGNMCNECGGMIIGRAGARYCSPACRQKAYRARKSA